MKPKYGILINSVLFCMVILPVPIIIIRYGNIPNRLRQIIVWRCTYLYRLSGKSTHPGY